MYYKLGSPSDDADFEHGGVAPERADPLNPLANFIKALEDLSSLTSDIAALVSDMPIPHFNYRMAMWK